VKPKNGPSDAYAPGANFQNKAFMDMLRGLQKGDSVTTPVPHDKTTDPREIQVEKE
jgi:hypothetical protein